MWFYRIGQIVYMKVVVYNEKRVLVLIIVEIKISLVDTQYFN